jgi:hypothetical protein
MPIEIQALQRAAVVLDDVAQAIYRATRADDPSPEAMLAMAHVMGAHEILTQLVRNLQLGATDAVQQLLKDAAQDRERLAIPDLRHSIRGEIGTALAAARLIGEADSESGLTQCQTIIIDALASMQEKLNGSSGSPPN